MSGTTTWVHDCKGVSKVVRQEFNISSLDLSWDWEKNYLWTECGLGGSCLGKIEPVGASHCVGGNEFLQVGNEYSIDVVKKSTRAEKRLGFDVCGLGRSSRE